MKYLEDQYKREVRKWLLIAVISQGVIALTWNVLPGVLPEGRLREAVSDYRIAIFPVIATVAFWAIQRYQRSGWRHRNREYDFTGEWRFDADIRHSIPDSRYGPSNTTGPAAPDMPTELFGYLFIDQNPLGLRIRRARTFVVGKTRRRIDTWKSTSCRLSESGDEIHLSYTVDRSCFEPENLWFGGLGYIRLSVDEAEADTDSRPLQLRGTFRDCIMSGHMICFGDITLRRRIKDAPRKQFYGLPPEEPSYGAEEHAAGPPDSPGDEGKAHRSGLESMTEKRRGGARSSENAAQESRGGTKES